MHFSKEKWRHHDPDQMEMLVTLLEELYHLRDNTCATKFWEHIAETLNAKGPAIKKAICWKFVSLKF